MNFLHELYAGLLATAFPRTCCLCDAAIPGGTRFVCLRCRATTETLDLHTIPENEMTDKFWGRLPVARAAALLPYGENTLAERVMRLLKYDDRPGVGVNLGGWFGTVLGGADSVFGPVDVVVPVPLHPRKRRRRGYNQAERVGSGIARGLGGDVECLAGVVRRTRFTETQTRKSQFERLANVEGVFALTRGARSRLAGRHVLLVDDVMTTGATLESLGREVLRAEPASLKVATLALARL